VLNTSYKKHLRILKKNLNITNNNFKHNIIPSERTLKLLTDLTPLIVLSDPTDRSHLTYLRE
jgi:hypothetical protein